MNVPSSMITKPSIQPANQAWQRDWLLLGGFALLTLIIHLALYKGYGFFRDELYFIACGEHLDWGYVDHPPGVPFVAWLSRKILGDTLFAIRFVPAVFAALQVLLTGLTTRAMGGGRYAQVLTCICVLAAPQYFGTYLNTDMFMMLGWAACAWVAARILAGASERLWLLFGLFAGLALQGKHAMLFFGFAFVIGLMISPQRKMLLNPWLWGGGAIAFLIALPNFIWEFTHNWATVEMLSNIAKSDKNIVLGPLQYLLSNINSIGIFSLPIWVAGLLWCIFAKDGQRFRALGWTWVVAYILFVVMKGKNYYLTPVYPMMYAAGGVMIEVWLSHRGQWTSAVLKPTLTTIVLLGGMIGWPFAMPIMSVEKFISYEEALHIIPERTETTSVSKLPQQYADMFGWPELAQEVARIYRSLPAKDQSKCGILGKNYGEASAIDYFGQQYGLPKAICGHQSYWLWGTRGYTGECLIVIGNSQEELESKFESVVKAGETSQPYAMPYEFHRPIWIVRGPKFGTLENLWPEMKVWI